MTAQADVDDWDVPGDLNVNDAMTDKLYVLPMRRDGDGRPAFHPDSMLLVKTAASDGVAIDYAVGAEDRRFVDHFSAGPDVVEIWLSLLGPITDVTLFALGYALNGLLRRRGVKDKDLETSEVKVGIAQINAKSGKMKGVKISGPKGAVIETVRELRDNQ